MFSGQVSDTLKGKLAGETMREGTAIPTCEKKMGERSSALDPQSAAASRGKTAQGGNSGVYLAWVNPTAKRKGVRTTAPFRLIEGDVK